MTAPPLLRDDRTTCRGGTDHHALTSLYLGPCPAARASQRLGLSATVCIGGVDAHRAA